jgi:lipoic acid synthetase
VSEALVALRGVSCDLVTITQYLRPTLRHHPVGTCGLSSSSRCRPAAESVRFLGVHSGPLVP